MLTQRCPDCGEWISSWDKLPCNYKCIDPEPEKTRPYVTLEQKYTKLGTRLARVQLEAGRTIHDLRAENSTLRNINTVQSEALRDVRKITTTTVINTMDHSCND